MSLNIGSALRYGFDRLFERNGLSLVGLFLVIGLVTTAASQTLTAALLDYLAEQPEFQNQPEVTDQLTNQAGGSFLALPGGFATAVALLLVGLLVGEAVRIVADRTFVSDRTDSLYQPGRNLLLAVVFSIVAGILLFGGFVIAFAAVGIASAILPGTVGAIVTFVGFLVLLVLAVYVLLGVYFYRQEIAVFDKGPVDALLDSWSLTSGERLSLLGYAVVLGVLVAVVQFVVSFGLGLAGSTVATVGTLVLGAFVAAYSSAATANVFRQLLGMSRPDAEFALDAANDDQYGNVDEEWR